MCIPMYCHWVQQRTKLWKCKWQVAAGQRRSKLCSCKDNSPPESQPLRRATAFCFTCLIIQIFFSIFSPTDLGFLKHMCMLSWGSEFVFYFYLCVEAFLLVNSGGKLNTHSSHCVLWPISICHCYFSEVSFKEGFSGDLNSSSLQSIRGQFSCAAADVGSLKSALGEQESCGVSYSGQNKDSCSFFLSSLVRKETST